MKREFEDQLAAVLRRAKRLQAALDGSADITYVKVKESKWVERHKRGAHTRAVITLRKPKQRARG